MPHAPRVTFEHGHESPAMPLACLESTADRLLHATKHVWGGHTHSGLSTHVRMYVQVRVQAAPSPFPAALLVDRLCLVELLGRLPPPLLARPVLPRVLPATVSGPAAPPPSWPGLPTVPVSATAAGEASRGVSAGGGGAGVARHAWLSSVDLDASLGPPLSGCPSPSSSLSCPPTKSTSTGVPPPDPPPRIPKAFLLRPSLLSFSPVPLSSFFLPPPPGPPPPEPVPVLAFGGPAAPPGSPAFPGLACLNNNTQKQTEKQAVRCLETGKLLSVPGQNWST